MSLAIIIPVWNLWDNMTLPCLMSVAKHTNVSKIHVYLVDNASTDGTATHAEHVGHQLFGINHFTYIKNVRNMGFAIACNQGAEQARADGHEYLLFLNNDTIVTPNWLPPLVRALANPKVGLVGPLLLYPDKTVQHCGVVFTPFMKVGHIYSHFQPTHPVVCKPRKFRVITGATLLCRTNEFFEFGPFYEGYVNGMEDIDLCYSYVEHGLLSQVITDSVVYHHTSQTPTRSDKDFENGQLLFKRKKNIVLDAHLYYNQDGYVPAITKDYTFYPRLTEQKRKMFNKEIMTNYSDMHCMKCLLQEPFWHDGYHLLMNSLEKQGKILEALSICQKAISYCFNYYNLERFIKLAEKLDDEQVYLDVKSATQAQIDDILERRNIEKERLHKLFSGTEWHDKFISTLVLDNDEFGAY